MESLSNYRLYFLLTIILNNILNIINLYEYITIVDVTLETDNEIIILALIVRIEVFKILGF